MTLRLCLTASSCFRRFSRASCMGTDGRTVAGIRVVGTQQAKADRGIVGINRVPVHRMSLVLCVPDGTQALLPVDLSPFQETLTQPTFPQAFFHRQSVVLARAGHRV